MIDNFDSTINDATSTLDSTTSASTGPYVIQTECRKMGGKKKLTKKLDKLKKELEDARRKLKEVKKDRDRLKKELKKVRRERDRLLYANGGIARDNDMMKQMFALATAVNRKQANTDVTASALLGLPSAK